MTLLIKNVQIIGGTRDYGDGSDVFVSNDKISAIGNFANKKADMMLDGQGAYLSPGFIDCNTDSDHYLTLFDHPSQEDFLRQGVTSIFGGMCGSSLAPLLYGTLESVQKWGNINIVNVDWHTMGEFLESLEHRPLAVNFGTLVGHSTIRRAIIGEAIRDLNKNELDVFSRTVETALQEGAFGFSTGLGYVHARKTPFTEIKMLATIVKKYEGIYATHLRQASKGVKESVEETIRIAKETGVSTLISHFMPVLGSEKEYEEALELIEGLPPDIDLRFDIYPSSSTLMPLYTFLPEWAQNGGIKVMRENIHDEWLLSRIRKDIAPIDAEHFIIAQAPANDFLVGKSLKEMQKIYEIEDTADALIRLMQVLQLQGNILYKNLNFDVIKRALASKRSFIASNAPSFADGGMKDRRLKSERTKSTFKTFLSITEENKLMPFADAIKKITIEPAKKFGLTGRGEIKEGNVADLVCFRGSEIKFTITGGKLAERDGAFQQILPGKALRHQVPKK